MRQDIALLYILQQTTTTVAHSRTIPQQHLGENWLQGKIKTLSKEIVKQIQGLWPVTGNFPSLAPLRIKICQSILLDMETVTTSSTAGSKWEGAKPHTISPLTVQQKKGEKNNITIKTNITYLYHYVSILYTVWSNQNGIQIDSTHHSAPIFTLPTGPSHRSPSWVIFGISSNATTCHLWLVFPHGTMAPVGW